MKTLTSAPYDPDTDECTIEVLRNALGLSNRRIAQLYDEGVVFKIDGQKGRYLFKASIHGYLGYLRSNSRVTADNPLVTQRHEATIRIRQADALARERENARAEKLLTPAAGIDEKAARLFDAVCGVLDQIAPRVKKRRPDVPQWVLELVDQEVKKIRAMSGSFSFAPEVEHIPSFARAELDDDDDDDELA